MILRRPGSTVRSLVESTRTLPEGERVYAEIRVMDGGDKTWIETVAESGLPDFEAARRIIGRFVMNIEGLHDEGGAPIEMAREADQALTAECASQIIPLMQELINMIRAGATLTPADRKNS